MFSHALTLSERSKLLKTGLLGGLFCLSIIVPAAFATGAEDSIVDNTPEGNNMICQNGGICANGSADGSQLQNQNTTVTTGANNNQNQNVLVSPSTSSGGNGGSSALVLPRNPLMLPNASYGRSNFGLQFGVNNNPTLSSMFGRGAGNALGWFMQGGVTIPFGKVPDILTNQRLGQLDETRQQKMLNERNVFANPQLNDNARATVSGKVLTLNAYNYTTAQTPKIDAVKGALGEVSLTDAANAAAPRVIALADTLVFSKPLSKSDKIGTAIIGNEYRYIGHTSSGWVKLVLLDGRQGWAKGQFEYIKNDYTEIDNLTAQNPLPGSPVAVTAVIGGQEQAQQQAQTAPAKPVGKPGSASTSTSRHQRRFVSRR